MHLPTRRRRLASVATGDGQPIGQAKSTVIGSASVEVPAGAWAANVAFAPNSMLITRHPTPLTS